MSDGDEQESSVWTREFEVFGREFSLSNVSRLSVIVGVVILLIGATVGFGVGAVAFSSSGDTGGDDSTWSVTSGDNEEPPMGMTDFSFCYDVDTEELYITYDTGESMNTENVFVVLGDDTVHFEDDVVEEGSQLTVSNVTTEDTVRIEWRGDGESEYLRGFDPGVAPESFDCDAEIDA